MNAESTMLLNIDHCPETATTGWVREAQAGNSEAFSKLYDLYHGDVYRMIYYRIRSSSDAEDIAQDVFVAAYRQIRTLKQQHRFRTWLFRIAVNRVRDHHRKDKWRKLFASLSGNQSDETAAEPVDGADGPEACAERQDFWRTVSHFLDSLPRMERDVFTLRHLDQLSINDISQVLDRSTSTIKTHLYRATLKFKQTPDLVALFEEI